MSSAAPQAVRRNDPTGQELAGAVEAYVARNPQSAALYASAQRVMPGGNTRSALHFDPFPLYVARSHEATIVDADGHAYLDVLGEFTAGLYGHSHPVVLKAVREMLDQGFSNGAPGANEIRLAELMCSRFPSVESIRFCNSGTEANLYALTLAKMATGRQKVLAFSGAYHGGVFVFGDGGHPMNVPFDWELARYNDIATVETIFERCGNELAAVIVEPVMSNGGCIPATPEFLAALRRRCSESGALLVFDEVVSSRMGGGGLQGRTGVLPDLTSFGKYLGAGFSFGAFGGRRAVMSLMDPTRPDSLPHAGTFNNNVFSMAAGAAALSEVFTPARAERLFEDGEVLRERLNAMLARRSLPARFVGLGSIMNIHFTMRPISCPEDTAGPDKRLYALLHFDLMEAGVYAARRGQINLSLPMGAAEFQTIVDAVECFAERRQVLFTAPGASAEIAS
jgi:glutamate-1-semialdehyde 2,1-aminomutase